MKLGSATITKTGMLVFKGRDTITTASYSGDTVVIFKLRGFGVDEGGTMIDNTEGNKSQSRPEARVSASRRRLLGGMVGVPIVALAARPALARQCTFSGAHSAFFASHHPGHSCSAGLSPGFYKENWHSCLPGYSPGSPPKGSGDSGAAVRVVNKIDTIA